MTMSPTTMTTSVPSVVKFMELRLDLQAAVADIGRLAEAGFGKRPLLKKDYQTLLDLMQEAVASAKYAAGFLRLIFQVSTPSTSSMTSSTMAARLSLEAAVGGGVDDDHPTSAVENGVLFGGEDKIFDSDSCEVSPKNVLELASDRGFDDEDDLDYLNVAKVVEAGGGEASTSILERSAGCDDAHVSHRRRRRKEKKERTGR